MLVVDERLEVDGNCCTVRDRRTGVMIHKYGPHIFHTSDERVWSYVRRFADMVPYFHRVKAVVGRSVYSFPINLLTINQLYNERLSPSEARAFISGKVCQIHQPRNFEEQALSMVGEELYVAFLRGYTLKQWGIEPNKLPASILKRLPMRFDYNDSHFIHPYQAIPRYGYTTLITKILKSPNLELRLGVSFEQLEEQFTHIIYTGPVDRYFKFGFGRLGYRTLKFEPIYASGDFQGSAVVNYCDGQVPFTRITEHKHFAPFEMDQFDETVSHFEFSRECSAVDIPYYPIRLSGEQGILNEYISLAIATRGTTFAGRLGTYRYLDMDATIAEALNTADCLLESISTGRELQSFYVDPYSAVPCYSGSSIPRAA